MVGAVVILAGILCQVAQLVVSIRDREQLRDTTGDPWDGRSLEWSTSSPPPAFNFAVLPHVEGRDAYWLMKRRARRSGCRPNPSIKTSRCRATARPASSAPSSPRSPASPSSGRSGGWPSRLVGAFATFVVFAWRDRTEYRIPAAEVARIDRENRRARSRTVATAEALS